VFIEDGQYTYISDNKYYPIDFRENINNYNYYEIYDYEMNLVKVVHKWK
jgi:sulfur relay (sulfurtransferase) DsrF/TusC family protein